MQVKNFISKIAESKLVKKLTSASLINDIDQSIEFNKTHVLEPIASNKIVTSKATSSWGKTKHKQFIKEVYGGKNENNIFRHIALCTEKALSTLEGLKEFFAKNNIASLDVDNVDIRTSSAIQLHYVCKFYINYARDLLLMFHYSEAPKSLGSSEYPPFTKNALSRMDDEYVVFLKLTKFFLANLKINTNQLLEKLPNMSMTEQEASIFGTVNQKESLSLFEGDKILSNFFSDPRWFLASLIAERQDAQYREAKEKLLGIQLRQTHLMKIQQGSAGSDGRSDESIKKEVDYNTKRIREISNEINEMDKRYGI